VRVYADEQLALPFLKGPPEALRFLDENPLKWERVMKRMGIAPGEQVKELGKGGHGIALQIGSDVVLKITDDKVEASAAIILKNNPMPEAYSVRDVFSIELKKNVIRLPHGVRFGIVTELLQQPDLEYQEIIRGWQSFSGGWEALTPGNVKVFLADYEGYDPAACEWLKRAAAGLVKRKIFYKDLKTNNIMKRANGEHVMIDFGHHSDVPNKRVPTAQWLEAMATRIEATYL